MNWILENKFVAGVLAVTAIGAALLLFLIMGARGQYLETAGEYERETGELQRLQALKPYPEEANFSKLTEQREQHAAQVQKLREKLTAMELPKEPVSPEQFQDLLRSKVSELETLAAENGVALPSGFYLGFPTYQGSPPRGEATERLGWQLRAIESVIRGVLEAKVTSIDSIERQPLPEEVGGAQPVATANKGNGKGTAGPGADLVSRYPFTLALTGEQSRIRTVLNRLAKTREQFLIVRTLKLENEKTIGPAKGIAPATGEPGAPGEALPAPEQTESLEALLGGAAAPGQTPSAAKTLTFILGDEKLKATVTIDIVDFAAFAPDAAKQAGQP